MCSSISYTPHSPFLPHQRDAFYRFCEEPRGLIFWDMGLGKTKLMIDLACYKKRSGQIEGVLLLAPSVVCPRWIQEEWPKHGTERLLPFCVQIAKKTQKEKRAWDTFIAKTQNKGASYIPFCAMPIESLSYAASLPFLREYEEAVGKLLIIVDEGTMIKNMRTKRYKTLSKAFFLSFSHQRFLLTGTALSKTADGLYGMIRFVDKDIFRESILTFRERYTIQAKQRVYVRGALQTINVPLTVGLYSKVKSYIGDTEEEQKIERAAIKFGLSLADVQAIQKEKGFTLVKHLEELRERLSPITSFLLKKDVLSLPEKQYDRVVLQTTKEQGHLLHSLAEFGVAEHDGTLLTLKEKVTLVTRALQICGGFFPTNEGTLIPLSDNPKLEFLLHDIEEIGEQQALVWCVYRAEIKAIAQALQGRGFSCDCLYGDVSREERDAIVSRVQSGETQILVANPTVAGYALNFQNIGIQYWYSRSFRTEVRIQAEDRSYRIGIDKSPIYKDLVLDVPVEHLVLESNKSGADMNQSLYEVNINELF